MGCRWCSGWSISPCGSKPLYEAMWAGMKAGGYLQIDDTPVKVLDPKVQGKAAQGCLWF
jgi:hypothetical protein